LNRLTSGGAWREAPGGRCCADTSASRRQGQPALWLTIAPRTHISGRPGTLGQLSNRQYPAGLGIRCTVPPVPWAGAADHQRHPQGRRPSATRPAV